MNSELIYPIICEVVLTEVCMNILVSQNNVLNKYGYDHIDLVYKGSWLSFFFYDPRLVPRTGFEVEGAVFEY